MNRFKKAIGILAILALAYLGGRYISLRWSPPEKTPTISSNPIKEPSSISQEYDTEFLEQTELPLLEDVLTDADLALADELLLSFNDQNAYDRFIANAERAGITIIARNSTLKALRVRSNNKDEARHIRQLAGEYAVPYF